jgi:hypothetical protein
MNTNTLLLVAVLVLLVGGGVWWYTTQGPGAEAEPSGGLEIEIGATE